MLIKPAAIVFIAFASTLTQVHGLAGTSLSMRVSSVELRPRQTKIPRSPNSPRKAAQERRKKEWIDRSVEYYSKVMRENQRVAVGQLKGPLSIRESEKYLALAKKHYFALFKIKNGAPRHAERIYRKIIEDLRRDDSECDNAQLAVTTLLLALVLQRQGDPGKTREVFHNFFRVAVVELEENKECCCSAKVLQAYALFEMKQGNPLMSLDLVSKAIRMDKTLAPVLKWKMFQDALKLPRAQDIRNELRMANVPI